MPAYPIAWSPGRRPFTRSPARPPPTRLPQKASHKKRHHGLPLPPSPDTRGPTRPAPAMVPPSAFPPEFTRAHVRPPVCPLYRCPLARPEMAFQNKNGKRRNGTNKGGGELSGVIVQSPWCVVCQAGSSRSSPASMARRRRRTFRTLQQSRDAPQAWGHSIVKPRPPGGDRAVSRADLVSPPLPSLASSCLCRNRRSSLRRRHRRCCRRSPSPSSLISASPPKSTRVGRGKKGSGARSGTY